MMSFSAFFRGALHPHSRTHMLEHPRTVLDTHAVGAMKMSMLHAGGGWLYLSHMRQLCADQYARRVHVIFTLSYMASTWRTLMIHETKTEAR